MPIGTARNWLVGSLFILSFLAIPRWSGAAEEAPSGELLQQAPATTAPLGITDESKALGQEGAPVGPVPSDTCAPCADEDCATICGMPLCSPPGRFWLRADALMWWTNGTNLPALVTSNSTGNAPIIGQPGTEIVFGDNTYLAEGRGGARMTLGGWLDRCHRWGVEADWFTIAGSSVDYSNFSNGNPATGRPFYDLDENAQAAEIVALGPISGTVNVHGADSFDSAGFLVRYNLACCGVGCDPCGDACDLSNCDGLAMNYTRTDLLFGFRHYSLRDGLTIHESLDDRTDGVNVHSEIFDHFSTKNDFNGAELGLNTELRRGRVSFNILTKMAFGRNHQITDINGSTVISRSGDPTRFYPVGIYAVQPNMGVFQKDTFAVIPQLGLELGYQVNCHMRAYLGYNILYWGDVMRAGNQIDQMIDPRNWAPPENDALPMPRFLDRCSNFWAQGINLGAEVRF